MLAAGEVGWNRTGEMSSDLYCVAVIGQIEEQIPDKVVTAYWEESQNAIYVGRAKAESNRFHEVIVHDVIETVADLPAFWNEIYRVCRQGAKVVVAGTYWTHVDRHIDHRKLRGLSERMFSLLSPTGREHLRQQDEGFLARSLMDLYSGLDFDVKSLVQLPEPDWEGRSEEARSWAAYHYVNVVRRLKVTLECVKPARKEGEP